MINQFLNISDPSQQTKKMTQNRVLLLSQKINNLRFGHKAQAQKKMESIDRTCDDIETQIQNIRNIFDHNCFDIKHIMDKIEKEVNFDYYGTDKIVKEEIRKCQERFIEMTDAHVADRKKSDARLAKFVEEKTCMLRDLIERQSKERINKGQQIEDSLTQDLIEIKSKLEQEKQSNSQGLEQIHEEFVVEYEQMQKDFDEICQKTQENENEFYKMLRDILKKVKEELGQDKAKREEMEETILSLIEKICDKAIEEVGV